MIFSYGPRISLFPKNFTLCLWPKMPSKTWVKFTPTFFAQFDTWTCRITRSEKFVIMDTLINLHPYKIWICRITIFRWFKIVLFVTLRYTLWIWHLMAWTVLIRTWSTTWVYTLGKNSKKVYLSETRTRDLTITVKSQIMQNRYNFTIFFINK